MREERERVFRLANDDHATFENSFEKWISDYLSKIYPALAYEIIKYKNCLGSTFIRDFISQRESEKGGKGSCGELVMGCHIEILSWERSCGDFVATHENTLRNAQMSLKYIG